MGAVGKRREQHSRLARRNSESKRDGSQKWLGIKAEEEVERQQHRMAGVDGRELIWKCLSK